MLQLRAKTSWMPAIISGLLAVKPAAAAEFYVDPDHGTSTNDGSEGSPWQTLEAVVQAGLLGTTIQAGDRLWLRSGYHGALLVRGASFTPPVQIQAAPEAIPRVSHVSVSQSVGLVINGLSISPSYDSSLEPLDMVLIDKASNDVIVEGCRIFSVEDTSTWAAADWINLPSSGISVRGNRVTIRNNFITNVRFGISVDGLHALIQNNQVVNFSADGLRGLGDYGTFEYNLVKNVYVDDAAGDANHDDGFQSWSVGPDGPGSGVVKGIVLRGNVFINREDPQQRFPNAMQGIGCFDGIFEDWVVENNVVATDHWHGISFYGMKNSRIVNNTVVDINAVKPGPPWIMVTAHKNGALSENVIVRNNLATDYDLTGTNVIDDRNVKLVDLASYFRDPSRFDFHLLQNAPAIDAGSAEFAPSLDADGIARPQGKGYDLGAFEWHDAAVVPTAGRGPIALGGAPNSSGGAASLLGGAGTSTGGGGVIAIAGHAGVAVPSAAATPPDEGCSCVFVSATAGRRATPLFAWFLGASLLLRRRRRGKA